MRNGRTILHVDHFDLAEGEHVALLAPMARANLERSSSYSRARRSRSIAKSPVRFRGQAQPLLSDIKQALGIVSATMHDQDAVHLR